MGINDIAVVRQNEDTEVSEGVNESGYTDEDKSLVVSKERKKRQVKKTVKPESHSSNITASPQDDVMPVKEEKRQKKRKIEEIEKEGAADNAKNRLKKNQLTAKSAADDNKETVNPDKKKKTKSTAAKDAKQEKEAGHKEQDMVAEKKSSFTTAQKKICRPKQLIFVPFKNEEIPEAHLSIRQSEEEAKEKKKANNKTNVLLITVMSNINLTLKPHESYLFKLNGYLQSVSKNLNISLCSEQQISLHRDLCVLNWAIEYNDDKQELIVPVYNRGNKTQKIQSNEAIALIRALSPDAKLVLKH